MAGVAVDAFLTYQFLKRLVTPFRDTQAFALGIIDADGHKIRDPKTQVELDSYRYFDRLVFNLKKLIEKVPGGKSRIATYAAALLLLREQDEELLDEYVLERELHSEISGLRGVDLPDTSNLTEASVKLRKLGAKRSSSKSDPRMKLAKFLRDREEYKKLFKKEDAPANAVGGGAIHGVGVGPKGEPGVPPMATLRRKRPVDLPKQGSSVIKQPKRVLVDEARVPRIIDQRTGKPVPMVYYKALGKAAPVGKSSSSKGNGGDGDGGEEYLHLSERLAKVDGKWALVSKKTGKPLAYYKGEGKPSAEWAARQERRIQYFKHGG